VRLVRLVPHASLPMDLLAAGAIAVIALAAMLATVALARRSVRKSRTEAAGLAAELAAVRAQAEEELATVREHAADELRRARRFGDLGASIELDEVLGTTLGTAQEATGSQAALVWLPSADGLPLVATLGLTQDEAERQAIAGPPDGRRARAIGISYRYGPDAGEDGELLRSGLAVPLPGREDGGYLVVFSRSELDLGDDVVAELEPLAERAGPAIGNAMRFQAAQQRARVDQVTGLHNRRSFDEALAREVARAHRYERSLALVVLGLEDVDGDGMVAETAGRVRAVVRSADIPCRVKGDELGVILPEATVHDAENVLRRLDANALRLSAGVAELGPDDDSVSLFERADTALFRARENGNGRVVDLGRAGRVGP
jgi:diguanylate cyclase (GGDEF)-like protein